MTLKGHFMSEL